MGNFSFMGKRDTSIREPFHVTSVPLLINISFHAYLVFSLKSRWRTKIVHKYYPKSETKSDQIQGIPILDEEKKKH